MSQDQERLVLFVEASLKKFERQMKGMRKAVSQATQKSTRDFAAMNREVVESSNRASRTHHQAMLKMQAAYDPVARAQLVYNRQQKAIYQSMKAGLITQDQAIAKLKQLKTQLNLTGQAAVGMSRGMRGSMTNAAFQFQDIAVQLEMGTDPMRVMGQQLPQLLGGFGLLGAVIGAVVGVGIPMVRMLWDMNDSEEAAKTQATALSEAIQELSSATQAAQAAYEGAIAPLDELTEKYGESADEARLLLLRMAELQSQKAFNATDVILDQVKNLDIFKEYETQLNAIKAMQASLDSGGDYIGPSGQFTAYTDDYIASMQARIDQLRKMPNLAEKFNIPTEVIDRVYALMHSLEDSASAKNFDGAIYAAKELGDILQRVGAVDAALIEEQIRDLQLELMTAEKTTKDVAAATKTVAAAGEDGAQALGDLGDNVDRSADLLEAAQGSAAGLAWEIQNAANAASELMQMVAGANASLAKVKIQRATIGQPIEQARQLAQLEAEQKYDHSQARSIAESQAIYEQQKAYVDAQVKLAEEQQGLANDLATWRENNKPKTGGRGRSGGGGRSGGRGGKSDYDKMLEARDRLLEANQQRIADMEFELTLTGKNAAEVAALTFQYEALKRAKSEGMALDQAVNDSGQTLTQAIDEQAAAVSRLVTEKERQAEIEKQLQEQQQFAVQWTNDLKNGLLDALVAGGDLSDTFKNLAQSIARAALEAMIFGSGPFGGGVFGGGLLGNLFGGGGAGGGAFGFLGALLGGHAEGGYTGDGGKYEPKGVVHGGEYVFSKAATQKLGIANLEALHRQAKGYAGGGFVGVTPALPSFSQMRPKAVGATVSVQQSFALPESGAAEDDMAFARQTAEISKIAVYEVLKKESRPGGLLAAS